MPTHEVISYDVDELNAMTVKQLAIQVIARQDLFMPKRENEVRASEIYERLSAKASACLVDVEELGIPKITEALAVIVAEYFGGDAE